MGPQWARVYTQTPYSCSLNPNPQRNQSSAANYTMLISRRSQKNTGNVWPQYFTGFICRTHQVCWEPPPQMQIFRLRADISRAPFWVSLASSLSWTDNPSNPHQHCSSTVISAFASSEVLCPGLYHNRHDREILMKGKGQTWNLEVRSWWTKKCSDAEWLILGTFPSEN